MTVEIYATPTCNKCKAAKAMCDSRNLDYSYMMVGEDISKEALFEKIGEAVSTVPQIFVDGEYIGGLESFLLYTREQE